MPKYTMIDCKIEIPIIRKHLDAAVTACRAHGLPTSASHIERASDALQQMLGMHVAIVTRMETLERSLHSVLRD